MLPGMAGGGAAAAAAGGYQLMDTTISGQKAKDETSLFDGIDTSLAAVAQFAGTKPPAGAHGRARSHRQRCQRAQIAFDAGNDAGTAAPIEAGLAKLRALRAQLGSLGLSDSARYEIDFRLGNKERDYEEAVLAAHGLTFDAAGRRRAGDRRAAGEAVDCWL
jgi:hypothetical protein